MIVRWSRTAAVQLFAAGDRARKWRAGADDRLYSASQQVTDRIIEQPRMFARVEGVRDGDVRRALVQPFGYWVIYEIFEAQGECVVLSFWSTRRDPQGWRQR